MTFVPWAFGSDFPYKNVKHLSFTGKNLEEISDEFFSRSRDVRTIEFRGLLKLKSIGYDCFYSAEYLHTLKLGQMPELQTIGNSFFCDVGDLPIVDVSGLSKLKTIGTYCFYSSLHLYNEERKIICHDAAQVALLKVQCRGGVNEFIIAESASEILTS